MNSIYSLINTLNPYLVSQREKEQLLLTVLSDLCLYHSQNCDSYNRILKAFDFDLTHSKMDKLSDIPFIPVSIFKSIELKSISDEEIYKVVRSSGTTLNTRSKIFLDKKTADIQQYAFIKATQNFVNIKRSPMYFVSQSPQKLNKKEHSSVETTLLGFSLFASEMHYALNTENSLDVSGFLEFATNNIQKNCLIVGLTSEIWYKFLNILDLQGVILKLSNWKVIHGGGWKKLNDIAVENSFLKDKFKEILDISEVINYYGMIEQTGNVFYECEYNYFHAPIHGDIIVRNPLDFSECAIDEPGIIQTLSILPLSYCGHSLLTGDEGVLGGIDNCKCGRHGKYFKILGRVKDVEMKGCANV